MRSLILRTKRYVERRGVEHLLLSLVKDMEKLEELISKNRLSETWDVVAENDLRTLRKTIDMVKQKLDHINNSK